MRRGIAIFCVLTGLARAAAGQPMGEGAVSAGTANALSTGEVALSAGAAKDTLRIRLPEAVLTALERNPDLSIQRLNPAIAKSYVDEARAEFDPVLTASAERDETKTQRFLGSSPEPFELTSERTQYQAGLSQILPTGTELSVDASISGSESSIYTSEYSGNIGLTVTQPLLKGFGFGANLADLRKARVDLEISRSELKGMAERLVADTEKAYWDLYLAAEETHIQEESLQLADRQLSESLERVAVGKLPELELAAVRAEVAKRQGALIDAQSRYEQARLDFLFLLNPTDQALWSTVPVPIDRPAVAADSLDDISVHEQLALERRSDLEQARLAYRKGQLDVAYTRNGLLPRLDFFITLGRTSYAQTFSDALPDLESPFYSVNAGVSFDLPIPVRQERARATRAKRSKEQLQYALQNMERMVQRDIRSAYTEVLRTRQQIEATQVTRDLQEKNLEAELEKFRVGRSTNLLVLQVQRDFTASQLDGIRATVNYLNALVNLYVMEGTLLDRKGINVPSSEL
jgi:outer membrane protein